MVSTLSPLDWVTRFQRLTLHTLHGLNYPTKRNCPLHGDGDGVTKDNSAVLQSCRVTNRISAAETSSSMSGSLSDHSAAQTSPPDSRKGEAGGSSQRTETRPNEQGVRIDDFDLLQFLGAGGFGMVLLARERATDKKFAIKVVDKRLALAHRQVASVYRERQVLASQGHPFIVSMRHAFQTADHLCFVLDYVGGGNMYCDLKRGGYGTARTRFYGAQVSLYKILFHCKALLRESTILSLPPPTCNT